MADIRDTPLNTTIGDATNKTRLFAKTGNKILIQFGSVTIGLCQSVDIQEDYGLEPCSGMGDCEVTEWVPTMARYTVHVEEMVLNAGSMRSAGLIPEDAAGALVGNTFNITFVSTGGAGVPALDRVIQGCTYASGSVQIRKHAIVVANAVFNAISVKGVAI